MNAPRNANALGLAVWLRIAGGLGLVFGIGWAVNVFRSDAVAPALAAASAWLIFGAHAVAGLLLFAAAAVVKLGSDCETHLQHLAQFERMKHRQQNPGT